MEYLTVAELRRICKRQGLQNYSHLKKTELITRLTQLSKEDHVIIDMQDDFSTEKEEQKTIERLIPCKLFFFFNFFLVNFTHLDLLRQGQIVWNYLGTQSKKVFLYLKKPNNECEYS